MIEILGIAATCAFIALLIYQIVAYSTKKADDI
jgi:hypothetical protein